MVILERIGYPGEGSDAPEPAAAIGRSVEARSKCKHARQVTSMHHRQLAMHTGAGNVNVPQTAGDAHRSR
jgi:hypothetical protein